MTQTISRLNKPGLILSERAIYSNYLVMSYGSDGRDSWIRGGSIPEVLALSQHRACGAEDGERHKRFQKSLRSSGYARWPGIALRWAAALATRPFLTIMESASQSPVVNWAEIRHCARGIQAQGVTSRQLPELGIHLAHHQSLYSASQSPGQVWKAVWVERKSDRKCGTNLTASWIFPALLLGKAI